MWQITKRDSIDTGTVESLSRRAKKDHEIALEQLVQTELDHRNTQHYLYKVLTDIFGPGVFELIEAMEHRDLERNARKLAEIVSVCSELKHIRHRKDDDIAIVFQYRNNELKISVISMMSRTDDPQGAGSDLAEFLGTKLKREIPFILSTELDKLKQP